MQQRIGEIEQVYEGVRGGVLNSPTTNMLLPYSIPKPLAKDGKKDVLKVAHGI